MARTHRVGLQRFPLVASTGRPPFAHETMLRIHFSAGLALSDLAMEEAFFETPLYRDFAGSPAPSAFRIG